MKDNYIYVWLKDGRICRTTEENIRDGYFSDVTYIEEETYDGDIRNGKRSGHGTYVSPGRLIYIGEWLNDMPHGTGFEQKADGTSYRGEFREGKYWGQGTYEDALGNVIEGSFVEGIPEGWCITRYHNQESYEGNYKND